MAAATYSVTVGTTGVTGLAAGASGVYIAAYVDGEERGRTFVPEGAFGGTTVANTVLPQLNSVFQGSDVNAPTSGGGSTMHLTWPATDLTDSSSPQILFLDEEATVVYLANNQGANTL